MKIAIRMSTWQNYSKTQGKPFDFEGYLREVKETGYDGVDLFGGQEVLGTAREVRRLTDKYGLEIAAYSTSVTYNPFPPNMKQYRADMRYGQALGVRLVIASGGFSYYRRRNQYPADYDLFAKSFSAAMVQAQKLGLEIAYYPHCGSIVETARETKLLIERLPQLKLGVDTGQLAAAGDDAVRFIRIFRERIRYVFLSDYHIPKNIFTELGKGRSKPVVAECIQALRRNGYDGWLTVSLCPTTRTPLESAQISRRYIRKCDI